MCSLRELFFTMAETGEGNPECIRLLLARLDPERFSISEYRMFPSTTPMY